MRAGTGRYGAAATILLLACASPATVRNPEPAERGEVAATPALVAEPAAIPAPAAEPTEPVAAPAPTAPEDPCQYWGTYEFFYFAEEETVAACLEAGEDPHARVDELGRTPLHNAARAWKESFIRELLAVGVDVNARDWLGRTPLHDAADWVRPEEPDASDVVFIVPFNVHGGPAVAALLEGGAEVDARDVRDNTPLHLTWRDQLPDHADVRHDGFVDMGAGPQLLEAGADPSARNNRGRLADPTSCLNWHLQIFTRTQLPPSEHHLFFADQTRSDSPVASVADAYAACVAAGADLSARDIGGHTVLHHAAAFTDTAAIALLLNAGAEAGARNFGGTTALHLAARRGDAGISTQLIARGVDVNVADDGGTTPLHLAARNGHLATVKALLGAGADANALDGGGTPLTSSRSGGNRLAIVEALLDAGMDVSLVGETLFMESFVGLGEDFSAQLAHRLLGLGADPNARTDDGRTALHRVFLEGPDVHEMLLDTGADPTAVDNRGRSPLHLVAGYGEKGVIPMLVEAGADVDLLDGAGNAPLHLAIGYQDDVARVEELLEAGADPSLRTQDGDTPLHLAAVAEWPDSSIGSVLEMLVAAGADVNARNGRGETPVEVGVGWPAGSPLWTSSWHWVASGWKGFRIPRIPLRSPATQGAAPVESARAGGLQAPLCDWSAGDYSQL